MESYLSYVATSITVLYIRLLKAFLFLSYHFWKAHIQSDTKHLCASRAQNDALEAARGHDAQLSSIEKFKAQRKEILMRSLLKLMR